MSKLLHSEPLVSNKAYDKAVSDLIDLVEILTDVLKTPEGRAALKANEHEVSLRLMSKKAKSVSALQGMIKQQRQRELKAALDPNLARLAAVKRGPSNW